MAELPACLFALKAEGGSVARGCSHNPCNRPVCRGISSSGWLKHVIDLLQWLAWGPRPEA